MPMVTFTIADDIRHAHTVPAAWYRDTETYHRSLERIVRPSWQVVGDLATTDAGEPCQPLTMLEGCLDEPLLLVRHAEGERRILSNVCTHRANLVVEAPCALRELRCRYHGRRFALDGRCIHMPEFADVEGFPAPSDDLATVPHGTWAGLLFASIAPAVDLDAWLATMAERLAFLPLDRLVPAPRGSRDYHVAAHWALYVENYLEGFHIPFVHGGLNAVLDYGDYTTELFPNGVLQVGIARSDADAFVIPAGHVDAGRRIAAYYWWLFPNLMVNVYPWGISLNIVMPRGPASTIVRYRTYVMDPSRVGSGAGTDLDTVEREDGAVVETVQRGIRSTIYHRGRYSPRREQGVHHFHRILAAALSGG